MPSPRSAPARLPCPQTTHAHTQDLRTGGSVAVKVIDADTLRDFGDLVAKEVTIWSAIGAHPRTAALQAIYQNSRQMCFVSGVCWGPGVPCAGELVGRVLAGWWAVCWGAGGPCVGGLGRQHGRQLWLADARTVK